MTRSLEIRLVETLKNRLKEIVEIMDEYLRGYGY